MDRDLREVQNRKYSIESSAPPRSSSWPFWTVLILFSILIGFIIREINETQIPAGRVERPVEQRNDVTLTLSQADKDAIIQGVSTVLAPTPTSTPTQTPTPRPTAPPTPDRLLLLPRCGDIILTPVAVPTAIECRPEIDPPTVVPLVLTPTPVDECEDFHFSPDPITSCAVQPPVLGAAAPTLASLPEPPCVGCTTPTPIPQKERR